MTFNVKSVKPFFLFNFLLIAVSCSGQTKTGTSSDTSKVAETIISLPEGVSPQTMFRCSFKDNDGNLWFGTTGAGVYKYDGKLFIRYAETEGLTNTMVYSITQDLKGTIWVGTENGIFSLKENQFVSLEMPNSGVFNRKPQVYCVLGDKKGNVWFGTENQGLWRYSEKGFTNFRCADSTWSEVTGTQSPEYKQNGFVQSLVEDRNGNIWINLFSAGLNYYDGKSFHQVKGEHSKAHVFQMIEDRSGAIWMATRVDGVCRFNGNAIESFTQKEGVLDNAASSMVEAKDGTIWFGSFGKGGGNGKGSGGISRFDGKTVTTIPSTGLRNKIVWTVIEDNSGNIWVGTKEFGLYRYNGESFTEFTKQ